MFKFHVACHLYHSYLFLTAPNGTRRKPVKSVIGNRWVKLSSSILTMNKHWTGTPEPGLISQWVCVLGCSVTLILCDPVDCSPPSSSVHWNSPGKNTRVGCWLPSSRASSQTQVSCIAGRFFTV